VAASASESELEVLESASEEEWEKMTDLDDDDLTVNNSVKKTEKPHHSNELTIPNKTTEIKKLESPNTPHHLNKWQSILPGQC